MVEFLLDKILSREVIGTILVIAFSILLYEILKSLIKEMLRINFTRINESKNKTIEGLIFSIMKYVIIIIDVLIILNLYGVDTNAIIASLGVVGIVAGLAVQDTLKDFVSGVFILAEDLYRVGDTVKIGDFKGEVIYLGLKTTRVKAYTGEIKMISNRNITEIINYSKDNSLAIVDVATEYSESTAKIEKVLTDLCERLSKEIPNLKGDVELLGIVSLGDDSVQFRIIAPTEPMEHFAVERLIRKEVKEQFKKNKINIPFRQVVIHNE